MRGDLELKGCIIDSFCSTHGLRFWAMEEVKENALHSYPLYAVVKPLLASREYLREALKILVA